jgi:hypothetical protein
MGKSSVSCFEMISNYDEQSDADVNLAICICKVFLKKQNESIYHPSSTLIGHNCALFESKLNTIPSAIQKQHKNKCSM